MGALRKLWLAAISPLSWRIPGGDRRLLTAFGMAEQGSFYDMLAAAELTRDRGMRRKYLEHALDEIRHRQIFYDRVKALSAGSREQAVGWSANALTEHGIVAGETLFERLGELEFMAFVYVAESDAVEQFNVYLERDLPDADTQAMLRHILRDEAFHVSYSRAALNRYRQHGRAKEVERALWRVRWRRVKEGWLRFSRNIGVFMAGVWLAILYAVVLPPFALLGRLDKGGWAAPQRDGRPLAVAARSQG